jgi:[ribosomal protein S5]-alanine N-acetyltransferase
MTEFDGRARSFFNFNRVEPASHLGMIRPHDQEHCRPACRLTQGRTGMAAQPTITTPRLILRPWKRGDASALRKLAGRREIADTMISVPHPFTEAYAQNWIAGHARTFARGRAVHFAITIAEPGKLAGAIELRDIDAEHRHAELSCWIGVKSWGKGFATEAASAVLRYAFEELGLNRIVAFHMVRNPASGRSLEKIGMKREGLLRQCVRKWGRFEDVVPMAILREDWATRRAARSYPDCAGAG